VAFHSYATNLVAGDTNAFADVFVHDRRDSWTTRYSVDSSDVQGDQDSLYPSVSADGLQVAFSSWATNLVPGDTNGWGDIFVCNLNIWGPERIECVSVADDGTQGNHASGGATLAARQVLPKGFPVESLGLVR